MGSFAGVGIGVGIGSGLFIGAGVLGCHIALKHFTKNMKKPFVIQLILSIAISILVGYAGAGVLMLCAGAGLAFSTASAITTNIVSAASLAHMITCFIARHKFPASPSPVF